MKKAIMMTVMFAMVTLVGLSVEANAQYRVNQRSANNLIKRIEQGADKFKRSLDKNLDRSRIDETRREDRINDLVSDFEQATNQLRREYRNDRGTDAAQEVLQKGRIIDAFVRRNRLNSNVERDWTSLKSNLDQLARLYRVSWNWNDNDNDRYDNDRRNNNGRYNRNNRNNRNTRINNNRAINYGTADGLIRNIETKADAFRQSLDRELDRSRANETRREDVINNYVREFEDATDRLRTNYRNNDNSNQAVQEVLTRGKTIDNYMRRLRGANNSKRQWNSLRGDLDQLARLYNVTWRWGR